ncbi:MAG: hypothetical protein NHF89_01055 [Candidatus Shikimatogenerans bostrichidophilus]|nr:MAG: hypothetical protein NHF89_01055 [Candidatus Shikimatogenerans bostrichidophilus]
MKYKNYTVKKQLKIIYSINILENKLKKIKKKIILIPGIEKKCKIKINNLIIKKKLYKKVLKNNKKKILILYENINNSKEIIKKYKKQIIKIKKDIEYNLIKKEIEYKKLEIKLFKKKIKNYINNNKKEKLKLINKKILDKKKFLNFLKKRQLKVIKKNKIKIKKINKILFFKKKKANSLKIYKLYKLIKKKSKDNIGIVSIYKKMSVNITYLIIPKQKYFKLCLREKILYDDYTGKILIDDILSKKVNNKINKLLKN